MLFKVKSLLFGLFMVICAGSQSGCVVGFSSGNIPLGAGGAALTVGTLWWRSNSNIYWWPDPYTRIYERGEDRKFMALAVAGFVLDSENPGRLSLLNPIPLDQEIAVQLGTTFDELETYNAELNEVIAAEILIQKCLRAYFEEDPKISENEMVLLVQELGFENMSEFVNAMKQDSLLSEDLEKFSKTRNLSDSTSKLYLKNRWNIILGEGDEK